MKFSKNIFHLNLPTYQLMPYDDPCLLNTADRFSSRLARFFNMQQSVAEVRRRQRRWRLNVDHTALLLLFHEFLERQKLSN